MDDVKAVSIKSLNIVKDSESIEMTIQELFNSKLFDELYAVTYVSSPRFFSKITKGFEKVSFILGVNDSENATAFTDSILKFADIKQRLKFWNQLTDDSKDKYQKGYIEIRFANNYTVHSKIYILNNSKTNKNRVIIGSANFTQNAFVSKSQIEDLLVFDNSPLFSVYQERFKNIYQHTINYIPERCKTADKEKLFVINNEDTLDIFLEEVEKNGAKLIVTDEQMSRIEGIPSELLYRKEIIEVPIKTIKLIVNKHKDGFKFKSLAQLKKQAIPLKTVICKTNAKVIDADNRVFYKYLESTNKLLTSSKED